MENTEVQTITWVKNVNGAIAYIRKYYKDRKKPIKRLSAIFYAREAAVFKDIHVTELCDALLKYGGMVGVHSLTVVED